MPGYLHSPAGWQGSKEANVVQSVDGTLADHFEDR